MFRKHGANPHHTPLRATHSHSDSFVFLFGMNHDYFHSPTVTLVDVTLIGIRDIRQTQLDIIIKKE
jgi:hypothetical protein